MSADVPVKVWKMGRGAVPVGTFGEAGWVEPGPSGMAEVSNTAVSALSALSSLGPRRGNGPAWTGPATRIMPRALPKSM